ncbi:MAG: DegV family protein [Christensenellales bacterium]|jgi:DegV family protein with EDD domain
MIKLVVDSTFGLSKDFIEKHDIQVVSLSLLLDDQTFVEKTADTWHEFFEKLASSKNFPKTSQPSPEAFIDAINKVYEKTPDAEVIIMTISETLSGTINSAKLAAKNFEGKRIAAIDARQATVGSRVVLESVLEEIAAGKTFEQILKHIEDVQEKVDLYFVPDTMEYLKRGGRIGKLSATLASVLSIKPIFYFKNGEISVPKKVLGLSRSINEMIQCLPKNLKKVYICYIYNNAHVEEIKAKLKSSLNIENIEVMPVCPVFGAHVGIGAIGLASISY